MWQTSLWEDTERVVNVANVPQRSPFRYPGGKTWLIPRIRQWLGSLPSRCQLLIEPFAGGGIVSLTAAAERLSDHVIMVELDEQIASVWQTIIHDTDGPDWMADKIMSFAITLETVKEELAQQYESKREKAFQAILKNRVNRGGIMAPGAGLVKTGEAGKGLLSRWYPATLCRRIMDIKRYRDRITFIQGDGLPIVQQYALNTNNSFFIDPPYTASKKQAGSRLYTYSQIDHNSLFSICDQLKGEFLMTYDNADEVDSLAHHYNFQTQTIAMKNTHHARMTELLISKNLNWLTMPNNRQS